MTAIVSADDHVVEPPDLFVRYLPRRFHDAAPRVVRTPWRWCATQASLQYVEPAPNGPEADCWQIGDLRLFMPKEIVAVGAPPEEIDGSPTNYEDMRPAFYEPHARLADMDVIGVERSLCFPNVVRFCGQVFMLMDDKELGLACVRAYNDWIVEEWCSDSDGRLLAVGLIPLWDPIVAAAEVRRNAARGVRAVACSELPALLGLPSLYDPAGYWVPLVEACAETGTVICMHIGSSSTRPTRSPDSPLAVGSAIKSQTAMAALAEWLFSGFLPRFPSLTLALSESQLGWMPYMLEQCDRIWRQRSASMGISPSIVEPPSHYFARQVYGCAFEDDFGLGSRAAIGVDRITFETDYPHQDSTWPNTQAYFAKVTAGFSEADAYKLARANALAMLGLRDDLTEATVAGR